MKILRPTLLLPAIALLSACGIIRENAMKNDEYKMWSFGQELAFFSKYNVQTLVLGDAETAICISPEWQARVMTSTFAGAEGPSIGWINRKLIALKKDDLTTNQAGGEDRFWVGPQSGDFSIFSQTGGLYDGGTRAAPSEISSEPWTLVSSSKTRARFEKEMDFDNAKGVKISAKAEREISLLTRENTSEILGIEIPNSITLVAYQSFNKLTNTGKTDWTAKGGMLNISVQSCYNANRSVNVFVPYVRGDLSKLGDIVSDDFFGSSAEGRLFIEGSFIRFKTDGRALSGIGVSPERSEGIALSYDMKNNILTVVLYIRPLDIMTYMPSAWRRSGVSENGDAISVFNNGPKGQGSFGADAFYEISTYSPALNLKAGKSQFHIQRTFHFTGSEYDLGIIAYKLAGITMSQLRGERPEK